jgi:hypothetical protein
MANWFGCRRSRLSRADTRALVVLIQRLRVATHRLHAAVTTVPRPPVHK